MPEETVTKIDLLEHATVRQWCEKIKKAKVYFEKDFKRMKENMEFAAGLQRQGQETIDSGDQYICNFVNREVNQKVAALYARDPKAIARRRKRLDFEMWDGKPESQWAATAMMAQPDMPGQPPNPQKLAAAALLKDIENGKAWHKLVERIGQSLEYVYSYECDSQAPSFKYQMKQLVRRTVTTGVGFIRINFSALGDAAMTSTGTDDSLSMREKRLGRIEDGISDDKILEDDPLRATKKMLEASIEQTESDGEMENVEERLEFDFPPSTSVIVDPRCTSLKGFIGARWIAQEYIIPLEDANAYFETDIKPGGTLATYAEDGTAKELKQPGEGNNKDPQEKPLVCLWEVFDLPTKNTFWVCDGHKEWVQEPEPVDPPLSRFWPIMALTFNDVEIDGKCKVHIYPPSDVELMKHSQREFNRQREELRKHRKNNRPFYTTIEGWLTDHDIDKLGDHEVCELIKLKGAPPNGSLKDAIIPFIAAPLDPALYNTQDMLQDVGLSTGGQQQLNQQPQRHVAATPAVIQEQSRVSGVNSNVDDLDDLLSELARASGEIMLRKFSIETVKRVAGQGAVWPELNREDFLNELYLDIVASSSGRPNKAIEIANFERVAPLLLQAGSNPWGIIQEAVKRLDDRLEVLDFYPTNPPSASPAQKPSGGGEHKQPGAQGQPLQTMSAAGGGMPLPGH